MNIVLLTDTFFPNYRGGTEVYVLNLAKALLKHNASVSVVCFKGCDTEVIYVQEGIGVFQLPQNDLDFNALSSFISRNKIDVIHIHSFNGRLSTDFLRKIFSLNIEVFFTPHLVNNFCINGGTLLRNNSDKCNGIVKVTKCQTCLFSNYKHLPSIYRLYSFHLIIQLLNRTGIFKEKIPQSFLEVQDILKRIEYLKQDRVNIIALSEWYKDILVSNGLKNVNYVPQAVDETFIKSTTLSEGNLGFNWLYVGRLSPEKGVKELIDAFNKRTNKDEHLWLVTFLGHNLSSYENEVISLIKENERISIFKNLSSNEVAEIISKCACVILPSKVTEMAPLVLREANALGKPVLTSTFIRENIEAKKLGITFTYDIKDDLCHKLETIKLRIQDGFFNEITATNYLTYREVAELHLKYYRHAIEK